MSTLSFTFDDGRANHVTPGSRILDEFGFKGTFYVCPGLVGEERYEWERPAQRIELASWAEIEYAAAGGHEIGNHSWNHPSFPYASKRKRATPHWMERQAVKSAEAIKKRIPLKEFTWAWPYHWSVTHMTTLIKEHHIGIRPFHNKRTYNMDWPPFEYAEFLNNFVDELLHHDSWGCAVIHDMDVGHNPLPSDVFRKHLEYVASQDIEVKTVAEVLREARS